MLSHELYRAVMYKFWRGSVYSELEMTASTGFENVKCGKIDLKL